ncbi:glycoside hydrolase family 95 protein, partial [bacterium]|nr:glycoside hydrolase family 95 protein [bacterium]
MKKLLLVFILTALSCAPDGNRGPDLRLWYRQPAGAWIEALPVGNGRLGAMVFGNARQERIQLNEDSMWPGGPDWGDAKGTPAELEEVRELLRTEQYHLADKRVVEAFSYGSIIRSHQTLGDLMLNFGEAEIGGYTRSLSLDSALATVTCTRNGYPFSERVFASRPDQAIVIELATADPRGLNCGIALSRPPDHGHATAVVSAESDDMLVMDGMVTQYGGKRDSRPLSIEQGVRFQTRLQVIHDGGTCTARDSTLLLEGAAGARIVLTAATSFYEDDYGEAAADQLQRAGTSAFTILLARHVRDHQQLFKRVRLDLGDQPAMPLDERLAAVKAG